MHVEAIPARAPRYGNPEHALSPAVTATLERKGIKNLFCHQAEALNAVAAGVLMRLTLCNVGEKGKHAASMGA